MHITGEKRGTEPELSKHDSLKRQIKIVKLFIAFLPLSTHPLPLPTFRSLRLWHHLYDLRQGSAYFASLFPVSTHFPVFDIRSHCIWDSRPLCILFESSEN